MRFQFLYMYTSNIYVSIDVSGLDRYSSVDPSVDHECVFFSELLTFLYYIQRNIFSDDHFSYIVCVVT